MDTERLKAILRGERSGDLDEAESLALEALLRDDPAARDALARAEDELHTLAARFEPPEVPAAAWARVDAAVKAQASAPIQQAARRWRSAPVWLAACAAGLLVAVVYRGLPTTGPGPGGGEAPGAATIVPSPTPPMPVALAEPLRPLGVEVVGGEEGLDLDEGRFEAHVIPITFGEDTLVSIDVREVR